MFGAQIDTGVQQDVEDKENSEDVPRESKGKEPVIRPDKASEEGMAPVVADQAPPAADATDLQIAWENLDTARAIWEKDPALNSESLAGT